MYLKSIEMHGFKSFAGRIVLSFNEGIIGIVGPNGSGKSNISDAVRWVLGEQSAKSLRGANMQDVIFAGTENRKALSFAYVCLTLDNSDHVLPIEFDEVSISRRIYRSGESEYQINKSNCRLKDIQELFYDTGIGKEGYSIIGQGQIERILSSKPEDRREIFDEAVGIVKYKKRKEASIRRLEEEEANLGRIEEVLGDLTERIEPLRQQSEKARKYLQIKERQKSLDINLYLLEGGKMEEDLSKLKEDKNNLSIQLDETTRAIEEKRDSYGEFSRKLHETEQKLESLRSQERDFASHKGELGTQVQVLEEKIKLSEGILNSSKEQETDITNETKRLEDELASYESSLKDNKEVLSQVEERLNRARNYSKELDDKIKTLTRESEELNKSLLTLKDERIEINTEKQKYETKIEQLNIQKSTLTQKQLTEGTKRESISKLLSESEENFKNASNVYADLSEKCEKQKEKSSNLQDKISGNRSKVEELRRQLAVLESRLESVRNIAERYEGYGAAVRSLMKNKDNMSGIVGVVADLLKTDKKYENAMETALGGAIQNIVTKDEAAAKAGVEYLKSNHLGRATFLPITAVKGREGDFADILSEKCVEGLASNLVRCDKAYEDICKYLLGRIIVADNMDNALNLAKRHGYKYNIVTLDGEQLRPGGSISGGRFKNNSNLLGRTREVEDLEGKIRDATEQIKDVQSKLEEYQTAYGLNLEDLEEAEKNRQEALVTLNVAKISYDNEKESLLAFDRDKAALLDEKEQLESQAKEFAIKKEEMSLLLSNSEDKQAEIEERLSQIATEIDENTYMEDTATRNLSEIQIEEANAKSDVAHVEENIERIKAEIEKVKNQSETAKERRKSLLQEIDDSKDKILKIQEAINNHDDAFAALRATIDDMEKSKQDMHAQNAEFLDERDRLQATQNNLEKEGIRLDNQIEKLDVSIRTMRDHIWDEYELTYHNAFEYKNESLTDPVKIRGELNDIAKSLREIGSVYVDSIEEYEKVREKYEFLTTQAGDLREGRDRLIDIIRDLDAEMKARFETGFEEISKEFNKVFKELFGGGEGILKLSDTNVLESGISIIAQPPGKKLSNIMQMSGGEKALTAIAILFAILNLKPSPFCLLDEIEAALDEQNVDRFAKYLNNLTNNTQFIIITHRRGTMNAANSLYGITMQEKGISSLVSVSLIEDELDA